jgi:cysteine-rich repeat protein
MKTKVRGLAALVAPCLMGLAVVAGIALQLPAGASAAAPPADKCELSKAKAAGKLAVCRSNVYSTAIRKTLAADAEKLLKCSDKINSSFTKAEEKAEGLCPTTGDAGAIETEINACVDGVLAQLGGIPGPGGDAAKCQASKMKEAGKYADCRFKALAKGINKALAPDFSKCEEKQLNRWTKLEEKTCSTTGDQAAVKADIDACYTAVADAIDDIPAATATPTATATATEALATATPTATSNVTPLVEYQQDFEALNQASGSALSDDGWLVGANVFTGPPPGGAFIGNYFSFPAPNGGAAFSAIATGAGGAEQGTQQLSIYSDYNNGEHANGNTIEALVFRERTIVAGDVGKTLTFAFDAKLGNLELRSTAEAFIKTIDPGNGYATTNLVTVDTTSIPATWAGYSMMLDIDASLVGQILQFGFGSRATAYEGSGIFYDNIVVSSVGGAPPAVCGDGAVEGSEQCDDGDLDNGDGCDDQCNLEPVAGEYAINGDFETGDKTGWTEFLNNGSFTVSGANPNGGSFSGNLVASVPGGGGPASFPLIKQANLGVGSVVPGGTVTVKFDLNGSLAGAGGVVFAEMFSEISGGGVSKSEIITGAPLFPNAPNDWTAGWVSYSFNLTLGPDVSGGVTLQLKTDCGANPGCMVDLYIDNVSVTVP